MASANPHWQRRLAMLLPVLVVVLLGAWLYDRHYFAVQWPAKVQQETVGSTLAANDRVLSKERHFAYGEGFARWRYKADASSEALQRLCGGAAEHTCSFSRSRSLQDGVRLNVSLSDGILTVEEWWS
jgi:hypothetical protein